MELSSARGLKQELRLAYGPSDIRGESGIAIGLAPGQKGDEYRVAVRVRSAASLPPKVKEEIEEKSRGEVDFRVTGPIGARPADAPVLRAPLAIGSSIGHYRSTAGTLGFFARRAADGAAGIVSNNHVLAAEDLGAEGDEILCPGPADRGRRPIDVVARLAGSYPRLKKKSQTADCAFARLTQGVRYDPIALGPLQRLSPIPAPVDGQRAVEKIGRTTGHTRGKITAFDLEDIDVDYSFGATRFSGSIEVESIDTSPFTRAGDSGSLVFNADRQPLGLVYACSLVGGTFDNGLTYLNPIDSVLNALGITFLS
jgi:hypothetical protein